MQFPIAYSDKFKELTAGMIIIFYYFHTEFIKKIKFKISL